MEEVTVLVTGFGPWKGLPTNESYEIVSRLPSTILPTPRQYHPPIRIITTENNAPVRVSYQSILTTIPPLLTTHKPNITLHLGLDEGRTFFGLERSAPRDGYHQNLDLDRKVFTKAESKSRFSALPACLASELDLGDVLVRWKSGLALTKGKGGKGPATDVRVSDEVGDFVCGFIYYLSLSVLEREKRKRDVVFLHVPRLEGREGIEMGVKVVEALMRALVGSWVEGRE